jgi:hypothetical protein
MINFSILKRQLRRGKVSRKMKKAVWDFADSQCHAKGYLNCFEIKAFDSFYRYFRNGRILKSLMFSEFI